MAVILGVLKIIGFVILAIIALIIFIMLLVLLSPICYNVAGSDTEGINGNFDVKWILGAIHVYGGYHKQDFQLSLRLFGYCIYGTDKKQKKKKTQYTTLSARSKQQNQERQKEQKKEEQQQTQEQKEPIQKEQQENKQEQQVFHSEAVEEEKKKQKLKQKPKKQKQSRIKKEKHKKEKQKKEKHKKAIDVNYFLHMQNKKELIKAITAFCKRILKCVLPKHCCIKATIGTGDPALTGYILGIAGVAKTKFSKLQITGDFTQKILKDVFLEIKGRIILGYLLYAVLRLVFVKPVQKIIIAIWKGYDKNGQDI